MNTTLQNGNLTIDAVGEKIAFMGPVYHQGGGSKDVTKVHFRFGTVVKSGGSGLTVSLQNVDAANGPPMRPDGTQDQTVAIANGDANFASNTNYTTAAFSASRTVAFGELLAVVIEYDVTGWLTPDTVGIAIASNANDVFYPPNYGTSLYTGTWATSGDDGIFPSVLLEYTDGSFGSLGQGYPITDAVGCIDYINTGDGAADERALKLTMPFDCECSGGFVHVQPSANNANFDIILYDTDGTTVLGSESFDANQQYNATNGGITHAHWTPVTLAAGSAYRITVKPTTTTNIIVMWYRLANADHRKALRIGTDTVGSTRLDAGAWTDSSVILMCDAGLILSKIDDGSGGAAGGGKVFGG
jgi:hypothetical protein